MAEQMEFSLQVTGLHFAYPGQPPFISDFSLHLNPGSRCLLVGANGAGKTTLLRIFAGKHMVGGKNIVRISGQSAFHDTSLTCSGRLAYLGESWSRTIGSAGEVSLQGDFSAHHMIYGVEGVDSKRREKLIELLDIDLEWRMHKVSDGQRRRVQICMGLLQVFQVLLLDEVTVDLDVVARIDLLNFLLEECEQRGATIVYSTHIFDGLEAWATHLAYVEDGKLKQIYKFPEVLDALDKPKTLFRIVEPLLRAERKHREDVAASGGGHATSAVVETSPWSSSRHMAYYK